MVSFYLSEARAGIEPAHGGFAVPSVTTSPSGHASYSSIFLIVYKVGVIGKRG